MNKKCMVAGIRNILKRNYNIEKDVIDIESLVDSKLSYQESFAIIKEQYLSSRYCKCCGSYIK